MLQPYTALIRQSEGWWIGWILEIRGVIGQERTRDELLDTLKITLREILEYEAPEVSLRTESESEKVKFSDILEFGTQGSSHCTESGFKEVKSLYETWTPGGVRIESETESHSWNESVCTMPDKGNGKTTTSPR